MRLPRSASPGFPSLAVLFSVRLPAACSWPPTAIPLTVPHVSRAIVCLLLRVLAPGFADMLRAFDVRALGLVRVSCRLLRLLLDVVLLSLRPFRSALLGIVHLG